MSAELSEANELHRFYSVLVNLKPREMAKAPISIQKEKSRRRSLIALTWASSYRQNTYIWQNLCKCNRSHTNFYPKTEHMLRLCISLTPKKNLGNSMHLSGLVEAAPLRSSKTCAHSKKTPANPTIKRFTQALVANTPNKNARPSIPSKIRSRLHFTKLMAERHCCECCTFPTRIIFFELQWRCIVIRNNQTKKGWREESSTSS